MSDANAIHNRRGVFALPRAWVFDQPEIARAVLSGLVIIHADDIGDAIEYGALGYVFDEIPDGYLAPAYVPEIDVMESDESGHVIAVTFRRLPCLGA